MTADPKADVTWYGDPGHPCQFWAPCNVPLPPCHLPWKLASRELGIRGHRIGLDHCWLPAPPEAFRVWPR